MKIINHTNKQYYDIIAFFYDTVKEYDIEPKTFVIDINPNERGMFYRNSIYLFPDYYETFTSLKWIIAHEVGHALCAQSKGLKKYLKGLPYDVLNMTEENFATMFACMIVGGCYDLNWYLKREKKLKRKDKA